MRPPDRRAVNGWEVDDGDVVGRFLRVWMYNISVFYNIPFLCNFAHAMSPVHGEGGTEVRLLSSLCLDIDGDLDRLVAARR